MRTGSRPATVSCTPWARARRLALRLVCEDSGEDLIEYALLVTFIGLSSAVAWAAMESAIANAYTGLNSGVYDIWEPPPPTP
jgi:Flp pilus assembly pilin Flp